MVLRKQEKLRNFQRDNIIYLVCADNSSEKGGVDWAGNLPA